MPFVIVALVAVKLVTAISPTPLISIVEPLNTMFAVSSESVEIVNASCTLMPLSGSLISISSEVGPVCEISMVLSSSANDRNVKSEPDLANTGCPSASLSEL